MNTAAEQHRLLIQDISFKLYKAELGMGMPYSREDVQHYRRLLVEALAADPNSAGVQLAAKLERAIEIIRDCEQERIASDGPEGEYR